MDRESKTDIVAAGTGVAAQLALAMSAAAAGVIATAPAIVANVVVGLAGAITIHEHSRRLKRLERILVLLGAKYSVEELNAVPENPFDEVVAQAVRDEDDDKVPFYGALLSTIISERPSAAETRLLASILRGLTADEMRLMLDVAAGIEPVNPPSLIAQSLAGRLLGVGVIREPVSLLTLSSSAPEYFRVEHITPLGNRVISILQQSTQP
jgi:hypothetical protein